MHIRTAELYALRIPFRIDFTHSQAKRLSSDSLILELTAGSHRGYGEAVVRDYVTGSIGNGDFLRQAAVAAGDLLGSLVSQDLTVDALNAWSLAIDLPDNLLPMLCAVETAALDLLCKHENIDIYTLLGTEPVRKSLVYGGTVPMLPLDFAKGLIQRYGRAGIQNLRLKIGNDIRYNRGLVELARALLGGDYDLRVDANGAWEVEEALENLSMLSDFGITTVEEPFGRDDEKLRRCLEDKRSDGFTFVADESVLSLDDLKRIVSTKTYSMINIRLSKTGGLLRSLQIDREAHANGIKDQLGCHVGETGILSAAGRVAASLMENPVYIDGSYDEYLLSENITSENLTFGRGGHAEVIRGNGLGFSIDTAALGRLSYDHATCL